MNLFENKLLGKDPTLSFFLARFSKCSPQMTGQRAKVAHTGGAFCSMKQLGVLLLPHGWDASPSQGYLNSVSRVPIYKPGLRETMWSKVSCLRKQHSNAETNLASNQRLSDPTVRSKVGRTNHHTTTPPRLHNVSWSSVLFMWFLFLPNLARTD